VGGLASENGEIMIVDYEAAEQDPALPFHAVELSQAYNLKYSERFIEDLEAFIEANSKSPNIERCRRVFSRIMQTPRGVSKAIRDLADFGALYWIFPELEALRALIPYDASHDYSVGEHSIRVVEHLDALRFTTDPHLAEYARAWAEIDSAELLYVAGLIHDMGKQWPLKGHHANSGANAAALIAARLGWDNSKSETLAFLVQNHLLMAETSRLRDLRIDETIRDFTRIVTDLDRLNMLYVLTSADTHAVGDGIWTEMRSRFLTELYTRASMVLSAIANEGVTEEQLFNNGPDLAKHRERIGKQLSSHNLPMDTIQQHMDRMPAQYLLNTPIEEIHLHIAMIDRLRSGGMPMVDFKTEFGVDYTEMAIVAYDESSPGLLAKIVGVLYALDVNLHGSRVFTRESSVSIAIDTLWMDYRGRPLSSSKRKEVLETMRSVLTSRMDLTTLFEKRRKPAKQQIIHHAAIDDETSDRYSILEVRAPDEPGVMYRLCAAVSKLKWNIQAARFSVWGSRVRAAIYVTEQNGRKINSSEIDKLFDILPREEFNRRRIGGGK
jgi:[protein-PII] uridylyltransferase